MEKGNQNKESKKNLKKNFSNKPKFNIYWVYGLLFVLFLGMNFINIGGNLKEIAWNRIEQIAQNGDIRKVVVVNRELAEIYIKKDKLSNEEYKDAANKSEGSFGVPAAQYYYTILTMDDFVKKWQTLKSLSFS